MTAHARRKLTLRWKSGTHSTLNIKESARTTGYEIIDKESGEQLGSIDNERATGVPPLWNISLAGVGKQPGDYATAEDALSELQKKFDNSPR